MQLYKILPDKVLGGNVCDMSHRLKLKTSPDKN